MTHKDGSAVFVRRDKLSRKNPNGSLLVILHDITPEVQLREMTKMRDVEKARTANAKKLSAYLAHEVRNQLYPQQLTLEEMRSEGLEPDAACYTSVIVAWQEARDPERAQNVLAQIGRAHV